MTNAQNEQKIAEEAQAQQDELPAAQPQAGDGAAAAEEKPTIETLQTALKLSEAKVLEHYDLYVRAMAELENTRRRAAEEVQKAQKFSIEKFAQNLLPVVDSLEKALEVTKDEKDSAVREGMLATYRQLIHALDVSGMKPIDPQGEAFNPHQQQAIAMVPAPEGVEPGSVVQVFQRGWLIAERVLRPAMVSVAQK